MIKGIKIFITVVFVILALLSGMMSFHDRRDGGQR